MILVTGAGGKTGRAVIRALGRTPRPLRAWVRRSEGDIDSAVTDRVEGDLLDPSAWARACAGVDALYLICPNVHPRERAIGDLAIEAARRAGVAHFVYHSVLHPQIEEMPHHWQKMRVEEAVVSSGLAFTILQPCAYMQNLRGSWSSIGEDGRYVTPYSSDARISIVDLADVAAAAALVLTESGHEGATYELAGPAALSQHDVAERLTRALGRPVAARNQSPQAWARAARASGLSSYALDALRAMFRYYDRRGFVGNSNVLGWLLGRPPTSLDGWLARTLAGDADGGA